MEERSIQSRMARPSRFGDQAFEWLAKAYEDRAGWLVYLKTQPAFGCLHTDSRFADLVRRVGL